MFLHFVCIFPHRIPPLLIIYVANPRSITISRECVYEIVVIKGVGNVNITVTTYVVSLKLFRLKAEGVRRARLLFFGRMCFLHQTWLQNTLFPNSLQPSAYPPE